MGLAQALLPEFDAEMAKTRAILERLPEDKFDWQPHEKSTNLVGLATHITNLPSWVSMVLERDELDINPPDGDSPHVEPIASVADALARFDKNASGGRESLSSAEDEVFYQPWSLLNGGENIFTAPKVGVLRSFVMNHLIHHRAQLGVYLRMNDVPLPSVYGPSADEAGF
ncbi:MAG: DinB family protein [Gemmatimonadota bacterium]